MEQLFTTDNLERAGLAVSLLFSIWINYKINKDHSRIISNHVVHQAESNMKLTGAIEQLIRFLELRLK